MNIIKNKLPQIIVGVLGAAAGFMYWKFIGCQSGTCPIKSVWYWSTLWGAVMGYLLADLIIDLINKIKEKKKEKDERKI